MDLISRPWVAAGVALAGAGLISAAPVAQPLPDIAAPTVQLTSGFDPLGLWVDVLKTAADNALTIARAYFEAPYPVAQQVIVNQVGFLGDFLRNPGSIGSILAQMWDNLQAGVAAPFGQFIPEDGSPLAGSLDSAHQTLLGIVALADPDSEPLLNLLSSPASGWLIGEIGTFLSPILQFRDDIRDIIGAFANPDPWRTVFQTLINMPANLTGAYLNGYGSIDLLPLLDRLGIELPSLGNFGRVLSLDMNLGGLLSPGTSVFNSVGLVAGSIVAGRPIPLLTINEGPAAGPIASLVQMAQSIAHAIGWNTIGNPLAHLGSSTLDLDSAPAAAGVDLSADLHTLGTDLPADLHTMSADIAGAL